MILVIEAMYVAVLVKSIFVAGILNDQIFYILLDGDVVLKRFVTLSTLHQFDCAVTVTDASEDSTTNYLHISILGEIIFHITISLFFLHKLASFW
jgi:hypothetical protein